MARRCKDPGTVTLETTLAIAPHRGLLAVVNPWAAADIDHVRLELFQGATSKGNLTVTQAQPGGVAIAPPQRENAEPPVHPNPDTPVDAQGGPAA